MDSLLVSLRFDSRLRICKKPTTNKILQSSFTIFAHVFLSISGRFYVKHKSKSSACQTLVHASTWTPAVAAAAILEWAADPTLLRKKWWVRFVPRFTFPIVGMYILNNIQHLLTRALNQLRFTPKVTDIFMQCLHLVRRFFVPLPWRSLAQHELQQGPDRLHCKPVTLFNVVCYKN